MWDLAESRQEQAKRGDPLTRKLRDFLEKCVKISENDRVHCRKLVKDYVKNQVMEYCRENSTLPIQRCEYTGRVYERLKTEAADEVDVMVVLNTMKPSLRGEPEVMVEDKHVSGYVLLRTRQDSKLRKYSSPEGYINPERLQNGRFRSLVHRAINHFNTSSPTADYIRLELRDHGPAIQLDIMEYGNVSLSFDLVPCFEIGTDEYFVPKSVPDFPLFWRRSFSLREKRMLKCMDKNDHGYRHELIRIVKTILKNNRTSLGALESYHLKTAFMHYIKEQPYKWAGDNSLRDHFIGFVG